nr:50S ribosomal protein L3 [Candidatus Gracilibacteria bacterium]
MAGLIAKKLEMTRVIKDDKFIPVTLLKVPTLKVVGKKTLEKDGYSSLVVGILRSGSEGKLKEGKSSLSLCDFYEIREFRCEEGDLAKFNIGDEITLDVLDGVGLVSVEGISKGNGFTGAMKKWNFHGGRATHGSKFHRALGSIGNRKPRRTHKGKKMHGHHGNYVITLKKVPVELVNKEISVVGVRGGVPGARNSLVKIIF